MRPTAGLAQRPIRQAARKGLARSPRRGSDRKRAEPRNDSGQSKRSKAVAGKGESSDRSLRVRRRAGVR
jgi:hypothetical protein